LISFEVNEKNATSLPARKKDSTKRKSVAINKTVVPAVLIDKKLKQFKQDESPE
jgi:hypothetical protein